MDTTSILTPSTNVPADQVHLEKLEERLAQELLPDEERQELRDRVLVLRRRLGR